MGEKDSLVDDDGGDVKQTCTALLGGEWADGACPSDRIGGYCSNSPGVLYYVDAFEDVREEAKQECTGEGRTWCGE